MIFIYNVEMILHTNAKVGTQRKSQQIPWSNLFRLNIFHQMIWFTIGANEEKKTHTSSYIARTTSRNANDWRQSVKYTDDDNKNYGFGHLVKYL